MNHPTLHTRRRRGVLPLGTGARLRPPPAGSPRVVVPAYLVPAGIAAADLTLGLDLACPDAAPFGVDASGAITAAAPLVGDDRVRLSGILGGMRVGYRYGWRARGLAAWSAEATAAPHGRN